MVRATIIILAALFFACAIKDAEAVNNSMTNQSKLDTMEIATLGAGCFWCVEAVFQRLEGVERVQSGYSGGHLKNPTYKEVCTGSTGHAEVLQVHFNPSIIRFEDVLEVFWKTHDPTTLNRQGGDVGTQYRSSIFYHTLAQKEIAEKYKKQLNDEKVWPDPVITEIVPFESFYPAEDYHNNYFNLNGDQGYCRMVIAPKVEKFEKVFKSKLKKTH